MYAQTFLCEYISNIQINKFLKRWIDTGIYMCMYTYIYVYMNIQIYIHADIETEKESDAERKADKESACTRICIYR
jgi:hypothetical protein